MMEAQMQSYIEANVRYEGMFSYWITSKHVIVMKTDEFLWVCPVREEELKLITLPYFYFSLQ